MRRFPLQAPIRHRVSLLLLLAILAIAPARAGAACAPSTLCPGSGDCVISGTNYIDNGCFLDWNDRKVTVYNTAKLLTAQAGHAFSIRAGTFTVNGSVEAHRGSVFIRTIGGTGYAGTMKTEKISNSPSKIDVRDGGSVTVLAAGPISILGQDVNADGGTQRPYGGSIDLRGTTVTITGPVHANGVNGGDGGDVRVRATDDVTISGAIDAEGDGATSGSIPGSGGLIDIRTDGDLTTSNTLRARGDLGGSGGRIRLHAVGAATMSGNVSVNGTGGSGGADGGDIELDAGSADIDDDWTATGNSGARGGTVDVTARTGALTTANGSSIDASGGGSGGAGGTVRLQAPDNVTLGGTILSTAGGPSSQGGEVAVYSGATLSVGDTIEARSTTSNGDQEGSIIDLIGCTVTLTGHVKSRSSSGSGQVRIEYVDAFSASNMWITADANGGSRLVCACADANADSVCDTPLACKGSSTFTNVTQTPSVVIEKGGASTCS